MNPVQKEDVFRVAAGAGLNLSVGLETLDPDLEFKKQGLDSLDLASLLFALEEKYGITVSDASIADGDWRTLNRMVASLNRLLAEK